MSRASSSDHQKLRIAVAMVALVHKPPAQSVDSYIIDLRTKLSTSGCDSEHTWRNRALWLEKRLQETVHILQRERANFWQSHRFKQANPHLVLNITTRT
ncbi:hypothetical protein CPB86DRAFT_560372 [Serendipita vermifera]|nr:hypothetical protein CPB86DRAFT_560372 [Serendipita vermifera]